MFCYSGKKSPIISQQCAAADLPVSNPAAAATCNRLQPRALATRSPSILDLRAPAMSSVREERRSHTEDRPSLKALAMSYTVAIPSSPFFYPSRCPLSDKADFVSASTESVSVSSPTRPARRTGRSAAARSDPQDP